MKYLITLLIFTISINCYSQSNRQKLEDIQDQLDMMEYEKALKDMQMEQEKALRSNQRNNELNIRSYSPPSKEPTPEPYRNTQSDAVRRNVATFFNLSVSEYLKRDEIGEVTCSKYSGNMSQIVVWTKCYQAKILDISYTEMEMRRAKADAKCNEIIDKVKQGACKRDVIVMNR